MGYLVRTDSFEDLEIFIDQKKEEPPAAEKQWKNWVFDIGLSGYFSWDQNYKENSTWTNLTVVKTNHQLKTEITLTGEFFGNTYKYDNSVYKTQNKDLSAKGLVVKSISDHWSAGFQSGIVHSTFGNYDLSASIFPSMEYNIFPYSKFTRKQLTVLYGIGYTRNNYIDTTIFNHVHENLYSHKLGLAFKVIDKWGNISLALQGSNYFHNWNYNKLTVSTDTRFRLFKGFYLKMLGGISVIHDQINLSASGIDYEQVLLQQKEILSTYYYWFQVGINFTFGDIYNSVVNPRFTQLF